MKILIATGIFPPEIGGPATYAALLRDELEKRGDKVIVLAFREVRRHSRWLRHLIYFSRILKEGRTSDLIFTQDTISTGFPSVMAAFFLRKKVVMRVAGDHAWEQAQQQYKVTDSIDEFQTKKYSLKIELMRSIQRYSVRHADVVITPSNYFSALVSGWLQNTREVKTIYNGIDLTVEFEKELKFPELTIISAGRLVPWKGFDTLIDALSEMPRWKLLIAGDGPDKERLRAIAAEKGVADRVTFLGQISRPELFAVIHRSHICALLSTFESFSFQIVEAMHVGVPVIASDIGNLEEIIETGKNGVLIDPHDTAAFVVEAERVAGDHTYERMLSLNAQKRAGDFSIKKTLDELYKVFLEVVEVKPHKTL